MKYYYCALLDVLVIKELNGFNTDVFKNEIFINYIWDNKSSHLINIIGFVIYSFMIDNFAWLKVFHARCNKLPNT